MGETKDSTEMPNTKRNDSAVCVALTSCNWSNQDSVEFNDGAEGVLGVCGADQTLAVESEDQTLVLFLQQNQNVLQEDCVKLWKEGDIKTDV